MKKVLRTILLVTPLLIETHSACNAMSTDALTAEANTSAAITLTNAGKQGGRRGGKRGKRGGFMAGISQEERAAFKALSPEEKKKKREEMKTTWQAKTPEERQASMQQFGAGQGRRGGKHGGALKSTLIPVIMGMPQEEFDKLTLEEQKTKAKAMQDTFAAMTPEKKLATFQAIQAAALTSGQQTGSDRGQFGNKFGGPGKHGAMGRGGFGKAAGFKPQRGKDGRGGQFTGPGKKGERGGFGKGGLGEQFGSRGGLGKAGGFKPHGGKGGYKGFGGPGQKASRDQRGAQLGSRGGKGGHGGHGGRRNWKSMQQGHVTPSTLPTTEANPTAVVPTTTPMTGTF